MGLSFEQVRIIGLTNPYKIVTIVIYAKGNSSSSHESRVKRESAKRFFGFGLFFSSRDNSCTSY